MPGKKKNKNKVSALQKQLKNVQISKAINNNTATDNANAKQMVDTSPNNTILSGEIKPELAAKWPKIRTRVPAVFLHKIEPQHLKKIHSLGINAVGQCCNSKFKISCRSFNDHKALIQYLDKNQLPYHTFGHPSKRKMKVVIKGVPKDTDLNTVKAELKYVSIPVIRLHKMNTNYERKDNTMLILVVVPHDEAGKRILKLEQILGHKVTLEPPIQKPSQCFRCQQWGHSQRYCHGETKCVKCGGNHLYKKCERDADEEPPKCANCGGEHTASYKKCLHYPRNPEELSIEQKISVLLSPGLLVL